jgi:AraC-like DNA-binding protein
MNNCQRLSFDRFTLEDSVYPPFLYMAPHTDKLSRISIILDGELQESHGSQNIKAGRGSLVIKPNHIVHENTFGSKPVRSLSISFNDEHLFTEYFTNWEWLRDPKVNVLGFRFWAEARYSRSEENLMRCFNEFVSAVATLRNNNTTRQVYWIEELKKLIEEGLCDAKNIDELSKKLCLHRVYLSRAFKQYYGASPVEFRKYVRISAAFFDLALTTTSLAGIAYDSGFSDQSHMTREFIKHFGYTPARIRKFMKKA